MVVAATTGAAGMTAGVVRRVAMPARKARVGRVRRSSLAPLRLPLRQLRRRA
jgi:hypothetical protein